MWIVIAGSLSTLPWIIITATVHCCGLSYPGNIQVVRQLLMSLICSQSKFVTAIRLSFSVVVLHSSWPGALFTSPPPSCHTCFRCVCSHSQTGLTVGKWIKVNIEYLPFDKKSDKARLIGLKVKVAQLDSLSPLTNIKSNRHGVLHNPPLHNIFCQQAANKQQGKNYAFIWRISHRSKSAHFGKNISVTYRHHKFALLRVAVSSCQ